MCCVNINRPRVLRVSVRDTQRLTPLAADAVKSHSTSRRPCVRLVDTPVQKFALVRTHKTLHHISVLTNVICSDNWAQKAIRRRTTGTGRMRHLKDMPRRAKNGFREGTLFYYTYY